MIVPFNYLFTYLVCFVEASSYSETLQDEFERFDRDYSQCVNATDVTVEIFLDQHRQVSTNPVANTAISDDAFGVFMDCFEVNPTLVLAISRVNRGMTDLSEGYSGVVSYRGFIGLAEAGFFPDFNRQRPLDPRMRRRGYVALGINGYSINICNSSDGLWDTVTGSYQCQTSNWKTISKSVDVHNYDGSQPTYVDLFPPLTCQKGNGCMILVGANNAVCTNRQSFSCVQADTP
ncbi:LAMI_0B05842g1_1 [Lachancea mirantina]|uniref:LAMI_0B05842g1_1 n=1 Tax=Lachancea mirantina TaxID=1230905 RepID=A0A1G4IWX1_9SACH|nr:LAMI_0B05842g1_1 [Lachancea mirantina]